MQVVSEGKMNRFPLSLRAKRGRVVRSTLVRSRPIPVNHSTLSLRVNDSERGNPVNLALVQKRNDLDCRASLAMTKVE